MSVKQVSYIKVGQHRNNRRIWLEGKRLEACGFSKGTSYYMVMDVRNRKLVLKVDSNGDRIVSGRNSGARILPIIDICNADITQHITRVMGGPVRVRVVFFSERIEITIHAHDRKQQEREKAIRDHAKQSCVSIGTVCAGGGISCWALHDGLKDVGILGEAGFILDIEGKYLQNAMDNNPYVNQDTQIFEASLEEMESEFLGHVDILNCSLPCTGFSKSGRAKNRLKNPESHKTASTAVFGLLKIVEAVNPAIIVSENVREFANSATCDLLRGFLHNLGYRLQERVLGREMGGALENRTRHILIAISNGLQIWNIDRIIPSMEIPEKLSEILDDVPADDPAWKEYQYLAIKKKKDIESGKFFRSQLLSGDESFCGTIGRGYQKARSTEPFIRSPYDPKKSRLLTIAEHCRVKGIPESAVCGQGKTIAHEILGQSVLFGVFKSIGRFLGGLVSNLTAIQPLTDRAKTNYQIQLSLFAA